MIRHDSPRKLPIPRPPELGEAAATPYVFDPKYRSGLNRYVEVAIRAGLDGGSTRAPLQHAPSRRHDCARESTPTPDRASRGPAVVPVIASKLLDERGERSVSINRRLVEQLRALVQPLIGLFSLSSAVRHQGAVADTNELAVVSDTPRSSVPGDCSREVPGRARCRPDSQHS